MDSPNAALCWTGGKDSALALLRAKKSAANIKLLVTFVPPSAKFYAHPLDVIRAQAQALQLPHIQMEIKGSMEPAYRKAIGRLKREFGIDQLITGDIDRVEGYPNWISQCAAHQAVDVSLPLWGTKRESLLAELSENEFEWVISCAQVDKLDARWIGKTIHKTTLEDFIHECRRSSVDCCGENGEYHSLVLNCPLFRKPLTLIGTRAQRKQNYHYLEIQRVALDS